MVEQRIENPRVGGSIPPLATIQFIVPLFGFVAAGLMFFEEATEAPGVCLATVKRDWAFARAGLQRELTDSVA